MKRVLFATIAMAPVLLVVPAGQAWAAECPAVLALRGGGLQPYCRNVPLDRAQPAVRRAVIVVHGNGRAASSYYSSVVQSASRAGKLGETLVVAPHFQRSGEGAPGQLEWSDAWKEGGLSTDRGGLPPRHSSFEVVDQFVLLLASSSSFPNLSEIVVTGHSAGGQFTQRYAATSRVVPTRPGLGLRYVVANPGSYLYLKERRWIGGRFRGLDELTRLACRGWNDYKYGLDGRSGYVAAPSAAEIRTQYAERRVTYLLGESDTKRDSELDTSCEADFQGKNRFRRGQLFLAFMNEFFAGHRHRLVTVPGVGHSGSEMYTSAKGQEVLFPVPAAVRAGSRAEGMTIRDGALRYPSLSRGA